MNRGVRESGQRKGVAAPMSIVVFGVLVAGLLLSSLVGVLQQTEHAHTAAEEVLRDSAREQSALFSRAMDDSFMLLDAYSAWLGTEWGSGVFAAMEPMAEHAMFSRVAFITRGGLMYDSGNTLLGDVSEREYYREAVLGARSLEFLPEPYGDHDASFALAVPISYGENVVGVLTGLIAESSFRAALVSDAFDGRALSCVCDGNGRIIVGSEDDGELGGLGLLEGDSILDRLSSSTDASISASELSALLEGGGETYFSFASEDVERHIYLLPLEYEGMYLLNFVSDDVVGESVAESVGSMLSLLFAVTLLAGGVVAVMLVNEKQHSARHMAERAQLESRELEFRIAAAHSDHRIMRYNGEDDTLRLTPDAAAAFNLPDVIHSPVSWLLDNGYVAEAGRAEFLRIANELRAGDEVGGGDVAFIFKGNGSVIWLSVEYTRISGAGRAVRAVLTAKDITAEREHALASELWRQSLASVPSEKRSVCEYNLISDTLESMTGALIAQGDALGGLPLNKRVAEWARELVHPADRETYVRFANRERLLASFYDGDREQKLDFRARFGDEWRWVELTARLIRPDEQGDIRAFLIYTDVDEQKRGALALIEKSETDSLTHALNRAAFERRVTEELRRAPGFRHALFMLDLDRFKTVNDTFGHAAGDSLLVSVGEKLRASLRAGDLVGRVGGDEFMLMLCNISHDSVVENRAGSIIESLRRSLGDGVEFSASIGIAIFPRDGLTFAELYNAADAAVYQAKKRGRCRYVFYGPEMKNEFKQTDVTPIDR